MGQRIVTVDDLSGEEGANLVTFGLNGQAYAIDLTETNEKELEEILGRYIDAARKEQTFRAPPGRVTADVKRTGMGYPKGYTIPIRNWLRQQGKEYSDIGRISPEDMDLWREAFPAEAALLEASREA